MKFIAFDLETTGIKSKEDRIVEIGAVLSAFAELCGDLPLVAHNAPFDFKFLLEAIKAHRAAAPAGVVLDTLPLARKVFPGLINYKLGTLVRHFGFPSGTFHRAEEDSAYCGLLFDKLLQTLELRHEPCAVSDIVRMIGKGEIRFPQYAPQSDQLDLF